MAGEQYVIGVDFGMFSRLAAVVRASELAADVAKEWTG